MDQSQCSMRFNHRELTILAQQKAGRFDKEGILQIKEKQDGLFRKGEGKEKERRRYVFRKGGGKEVRWSLQERRRKGGLLRKGGLFRKGGGKVVS